MRLMVDLSIIIPVHNAEKHIGLNLKRLLTLDIPNLEFIVVMNGTTDKSRKIVKRLAQTDNRIRLINHKKLGAGKARNIGLNYATGQYIAFVDADDLIHPRGYKEAYEMLQKSGSDFVCFNFQRLRIGKTSPSRLAKGIKENQTRQRLIDHPKILYSTTLWNKIYRRDFYEKSVHPIPEKSLFEDFLPNLKSFTEAKAFDISASIGYYWRMHNSQATSKETTYSEKSVLARVQAISECLEYLEDKNPKFMQYYMQKIAAHDLNIIVNSTIEIFSDEAKMQIIALIKPIIDRLSLLADCRRETALAQSRINALIRQ